MINKDQCHPVIYKHGEFFALDERPKAKITERCKLLSEDPQDNFIYDWHYIAGRGRILRLDKDNPMLVNS